MFLVSFYTIYIPYILILYNDFILYYNKRNNNYLLFF